MVVYEVVCVENEGSEIEVETSIFANFEDAKEKFLSLYEEHKDEEYEDEDIDFESRGAYVGFNENGDALYLWKKEVL